MQMETHSWASFWKAGGTLSPAETVHPPGPYTTEPGKENDAYKFITKRNEESQDTEDAEEKG